ncbi:MAG: carboxymuconolactone decarboxylase family protein [Dehalococcoidia bacterium]|nr:carboxymuconolactone decarboxylase family protein [Dehalococcoidia bacterium]TEU02819.1 MAG: carboxymuconolactone decarboxylase family protein [Dehalococcoidia bacterium]
MDEDREQPIWRIATGKSDKMVCGSFRGLLEDLWFLTKNVRSVINVSRRKMVSRAFRERLMLAVVSVYGCPLCSWLHTGGALRSGIAEEEIIGLLVGSVDNCPEDEAVAVLYAQHWADSDAKPEPEAVKRLEQTYGTEKARVVNTILHMNRIGEYSFSVGGLFLYRISFGRWGK